jgi:hypothetical protein
MAVCVQVHDVHQATLSVRMDVVPPLRYVDTQTRQGALVNQTLVIDCAVDGVNITTRVQIGDYAGMPDGDELLMVALNTHFLQIDTRKLATKS